MEGLVIAKNTDQFCVESENQEYYLKPSGKTKLGGIFVGDKVEFDGQITGVLPRKNLLIRPPVANVDKIFIVFSQLPKPDYALIDKIIIYCKINDILPILVINKIDICTDEFISNIKEIYKNFKIVEVSAKNGDVLGLEENIVGNCVLAGQSAVGKSSLINAIFNYNEQVGELSKKIDRGKQTTRIVKMFKYNRGYIADTAGFSLLDLSMVTDLTPRELASYYPDFLKYLPDCKYRTCLHEGGECGIIKAVKLNKINRQRYENYLKILNELKNSKKF